MRLTITIASPFTVTLYTLGIAAELCDNFGMPTLEQRRRIARRFHFSASVVDSARAVLDGYALWRWIKVGCLHASSVKTIDRALSHALTIGAQPIADLLRAHSRAVPSRQAQLLQRELKIRWRRNGGLINQWMRRAYLHPPKRTLCAIVPGLGDLGEAVPGVVVLGDRFPSSDFAFAVVCEELLHLTLESSKFPARARRLFPLLNRALIDEVVAGYFLAGLLKSLAYPQSIIDQIVYRSYGRGRWVRELDRRWGACR